MLRNRLNCVDKKWTLLFLSLISVFFLAGCASLLERQYSSVEPHTRKFWESEAAGTLRAETYADIVNDLLILVGQHSENATLRLYNFNSEQDSYAALDRAAMEVKLETPMGAYAVSYITFSLQSQRGYNEAKVEISYKRTAEQLQAVVSATSPEAVYSLLETALLDGRTELAVRIGYWPEDGREQVAGDVVRLREDRGLTQTPPWTVAYYPEGGPVGLIEFDLNPPDPAETDGQADEQADGQNGPANGQPDGEAVGQMDGQEGGQTEGQTEELPDNQRKESVDNQEAELIVNQEGESFASREEALTGEQAS